jgi:hypothetical protein
MRHPAPCCASRDVRSADVREAQFSTVVEPEFLAPTTEAARRCRAGRVREVDSELPVLVLFD